MLRAAIIDDEKQCIERLRKLLANQFSALVELTECLETVEEGIRYLSNNAVDLLFLDVQLNGSTGFDLLQQLSPMNFAVIFTTAYEQYAVQAFKCSAVDYLLKPVEANDLGLALTKVQTRFSAAEYSRRYEALLHNLCVLPDTAKRIGIPTLSGLEFVNVGDIMRCESNVNYTTIYLKDKQKMTVARTLREFEDLLEPYHFFRVHNSHLVNLSYVRSYNKGKGGWIVMADRSLIEVSTRRKEAFLKRMATF